MGRVDKQVLVEFAVLHDEEQVVGLQDQPDVLRRVAAPDQNVGPGTLLDHAQLGALEGVAGWGRQLEKGLTRVRRGHLHGVQRGETEVGNFDGVGHVDDGIVPVVPAKHVRARHHLDTVLFHQLGDTHGALGNRRSLFLHVLGKPVREVALAEGVVAAEGLPGPPDVFLGHALDGLLADQEAVLVELHPGVHRLVVGCIGIAVNRHVAAIFVGYLHGRLHLFQRGRVQIDRVKCAGNATARHHLQEISAALEVPAADTVPLGDPIRDVGVVDQVLVVAHAGAVVVGPPVLVTPGRPQGRPGAVHARTRQDSRVDRALEREGVAGDVADRGEAGLQQVLGGARRVGSLGVGVPVVGARPRTAVQHQVLVHVDQAGGHDATLAVDLLGARGLDGLADLLDLVPLDQHVRARHDRVARSVPDVDVGDQDPDRGLFLLSDGRCQTGGRQEREERHHRCPLVHPSLLLSIHSSLLLPSIHPSFLSFLDLESSRSLVQPNVVGVSGCVSSPVTRVSPRAPGGREVPRPRPRPGRD